MDVTAALYGLVTTGVGMGRSQEWPGPMRDRYDMHGGLGWAGWLVMVLIILMLVAVVIGVVLLLVRGPGRTTSAPGGAGPAPRQSAAEQALDERFARGEIDEQEYLHRRSVLRSG